MAEIEFNPNPACCPLCGEANACGLLSDNNKDKTPCWCHDPSMTFPAALIQQIPTLQNGKILRGQACICKNCVLNYDAQRS